MGAIGKKASPYKPIDLLGVNDLHNAAPAPALRYYVCMYILAFETIRSIGKTRYCFLSLRDFVLVYIGKSQQSC